MALPEPRDRDEFRELYDERTLARIEGRPSPRGTVVADAGTPGPASAPASPRGFGRWAAGPVLAAALLAVGDVLDPAGKRPEIVDYDPDLPDEDDQLVTFIHVPGDPRASRLIVRPWLLAG